MTAKQADSKEPSNQIRRRRRHWFDHEKISIINAFDNHELPRVPGKPAYVTDPKSKEVLSVFLIEQWRDQFRGLGLIKGEAAPKPVAEPKVQSSRDVGIKAGISENAIDVLLNLLQENQELKSRLKMKPVARKRANYSSEMQASK